MSERDPQRFRFSCALGHDFHKSAVDVCHRNLWCPHFTCLRFAHETPRDIEDLTMSELMLMADACGVEVRDSEQDVTHDPFTSLWWHCSHGCEFLGAPAQCAAVPGWCLECQAEEATQINNLHEIAEARGGKLVQVLNPLTDEGTLHWHRDTESLLELACARGHAFASTISVLYQAGWCPVCEAEQRGPQRPAGRASAPSSAQTQRMLELELRVTRTALLSQMELQKRTHAALIRMRGERLSGLAPTQLDALEAKLCGALRKVRKARSGVQRRFFSLLTSGRDYTARVLRHLAVGRHLR